MYLGLISLLIGGLFTIIGIIGALDSIEAAGDISPSLVVGGIKASFAPAIYGYIIFIISIALKIISLIILEFNKEDL